MRHILRYTALLIAMEIVFSGIAFLLADWPWLAVLPAPAFVALVWLAGKSFAADWDRPRGATAAAAALIGLVWQLPGLQGTIRFLTDSAGWTQYDGITDLQDFLMQTWHTVFLTVFSHVSGQVAGYYAVYYISLVLASPLLILLFMGGALWTLRRHGHA